MRIGWLLLAGCGLGSAQFGDRDRDGTPADGDVEVEADTDADADADTDTLTSWTGSFPLCINEIMPENLAAHADETGAYPDWIELHNPSDAGVSLAGWTISDGDPARHALGDLEVPAGGFVVLYADGFPSLGPAHLSFSLDADGEEVELYAPDGTGSVVVFGPVAGDLSAARVPDCCAGEGCWQYPFGGTPGASNVSSEATTPLIAAGSTWRYSDLGFLPGLDWFSTRFDDTGWASGPAPLGYGNDPATVLSFGADPAQRFETAWFRSTFDVVDPAGVQTLRLRVLRDDGIAVFVNEIPVYRNNLPAETGEDVLAVNPVEGADEAVWLEAVIPADVLAAGPNTVAVEVHQAAVDSDDLGFDLELLTFP